MKNFKRIDDYFSDNLTADLKEEFEHELSKDKELRNDYDTYRASQNLIEFMVQEDLMGRLPQLVSDDEDIQYASSYNINTEEQDYVHTIKEPAKIVSIDLNSSSSNESNQKNSYNRSFKMRLRIAASFLIIIIGGSLVWMNIRSNDFSQITKDNIAYLDLSQMRGGDNINENYSKLITLQEEGEYTKANNTIDQLMAADPANYSYLIYFKAQNNFRLKNFAEADKQFEQVIRANMPKYTEDAQLMRVFTAVELDNIQLAKTRIAELESQPMYAYKAKLAEIKSKL